ncbi:LacI family DNA-binding transcriptional regulator [Neobacillus sp. SM06]|uniref:LacI family DNA-binding transcriptional regulator n=1 Tax=Neobacillus sp. SM06 TaxID=3422492 RepID=UPI003D2865E4
MKITINDIAKMAGVSISTVSRVINDSKPVKDDVRQRVLNAIKQTNYRPNSLNNNLSKNDSTLIGVITPEYSNTILPNFMDGISKILKLYDYDIMIGLTDSTHANEIHYLNLFQEKQTQGIIFVGSPFNNHHVEVLKEIPCVVAGQISPISSIPSVHVDNITASYEAVTYLIQKGHRKIAMIRAIDDNNAVGGDRFTGFKQALLDAGIPITNEWVVESDFSVEDGMEAMRRISESGSMPSAVFCASDSMAIGAMNYLLDNGVRIPEDISVFGFDGSLMSSIVRPKLSTVAYSAKEMGMTAARNLVKIIKGETVSPHHYNVTHHLEIRESTR